MTKNSRLLLGSHMYITGGADQAVQRGKSIGCSTIQIFTKSNRRWKAKPLTNEQINLFKNAVKEAGVWPIIAHASYLINLGSVDPEIRKKSIEAMIDELDRCEQLGIPYLVLHPGSAKDITQEQALKNIAKNLDYIFSKQKGKTKVLLETMSGQGTGTCYTFEHIAEIIKQSKNKKRLGVCLDTCHIFVAGYDIRTQNTYEKVWQLFDKILGLGKLHVIHLNDSKKDFGTRVDRHEHIGKGKIGLEAFRLLLNDERFFDIPKILETPKDKELIFDKQNLKTSRGLLSAKTKKLLGEQ